MRALVVDDSRAIRGIIAKIMRSLNFETVEASNGREAMESLERDGSYDVVTVNWEMPVMDGLAFVDAVRRDQRFRKLPLLMISSESDEHRVASALQHGVDQYLIKPCTLKSISQKLTAMGLKLPPAANPEPIRDPVKSPTTERIRVLLVDDSAVVRRVLKSTLETCDGFEVIGAARDGIEGLAMIHQLHPDVVLLDVDMPRMDGLEMLRRLRAEKASVPIVMFSSRTERGAKTATDALLLGAKDFVFKPGGASMGDLQAGQRAIAQEVVPRLRWLTRRRDAAASTATSSMVNSVTGSMVNSATGATNSATAAPHPMTRVDLVVVAASTGGPAALATLVNDPSLLGRLWAPILIVQHMPAMFTKHLSERLAKDSGLDIAEAAEGEILQPGMIRMAPGGRHAAVKRQGRDLVTIVHDDPPVNSCRPSADVLFLSAAECVKQHALAVVLTGMGHDGRDGCRGIHKQGGRILVQDEATSVIWGMPGSVVKEGLADQVLPIDKIAARMACCLQHGRHG